MSNKVISRLVIGALQFLLLLNTVPVFGQAQIDTNRDCLKPIGLQMGLLKAYQNELDSRILIHFSDYQLVRFAAGELFWAIELDTANLTSDQYRIKLVSADQSIWDRISRNEPLREIEVSIVKKTIDKGDAALVFEIFDKALSTISGDCGIQGLDGQSFEFANTRAIGRHWTGELKSEKRMDSFASLCLEISKEMQKEGETIVLSPSIKARVNTLKKRF